METKDGNQGIDIWHMECSDHAAVRMESCMQQNAEEDQK
jgi:hypothetical protein